MTIRDVALKHLKEAGPAAETEEVTNENTPPDKEVEPDVDDSVRPRIFIIWPGNPFLTKDDKSVEQNINEAVSIIRTFNVNMKNVLIYRPNLGQNGDFMMSAFQQWRNSELGAKTSLDISGDLGFFPSPEALAKEINQAYNSSQGPKPPSGGTVTTDIKDIAPKMQAGYVCIVCDKFYNEDMKRVADLLEAGSGETSTEDGEIQVANAKSAFSKVPVAIVNFTQSSDKARENGKAVYNGIMKYLQNKSGGKTFNAKTNLSTAAKNATNNAWSFENLKTDVGKRDYLNALVADVETCKKNTASENTGVIKSVMADVAKEWTSAIMDSAGILLDCAGLSFVKRFVKKGAERKPDQLEGFLKSDEFNSISKYLEDKPNFFNEWKW